MATLKAALLIISDTATQDPTTDKCTEALKTVFAENSQNVTWDVVDRQFVPDQPMAIQRAIAGWTDGSTEERVNLVVCSGGTGFSERDVTPEVSLFELSRGEEAWW